MLLPVESPFKTYTGRDGKPLNNGYVYFGVPNLNPITSPVTVYWDAAGTQPAAQPIRTENGYFIRNGCPANVFFSGEYSELVLDSKKRQVFYARTSDDFSIATVVLDFIMGIGSSAGSSLLGFIQAGAGAIAATMQDKGRERVSVQDFMTAAEKADVRSGLTTLDVTASVQKAIDYVRSVQLLKVESSTYTTVCAPRLYFPYGRYLVSGLTLYESIDMFGDRAVIVGSSSLIDILTATSARWLNLRDLVFVGGKSAVRLGNANLDATRYNIDRCEFHGGAYYPIYSVASGAYTHLSATTFVTRCKFMRTFGYMRNVCDYAIYEKCDLYADKGNWLDNMGGFLNDVCDGNNRLIITDCTGVPTMGTYGVDRRIKPFWITQKQGDVVLTRFRAGGEGGGMATIDFSAPPATVSPYIGSSVIIDGGEIAAGPQAAIESSIIYLHGQVPQHISIQNVRGPYLNPYINNRDGLVNFATYFTAFTTASGQPAYNCFRFNVENMQSQSPDFTVPRVPFEMLNFTRSKQTSVSRTTSQAIPSGVATSIVFDKIESDNMGAWSNVNGNRMNASNLANRSDLNFTCLLAAGIGQGLIELRIYDSSGNQLAATPVRVDLVTGSGLATTPLTITYPVFATALPEWWEAKIYCTSGGGCTIVAGSAHATITQQNPVG